MNGRWMPMLAVAAATALSNMAFAASADVVVRSTQGGFEEVKERVLHAIESRGLVLNYTARVGAMLDRTGKDIGAARQVYRNAETLEFCSAKISRDTMEADPRNIAFCPYSIAIYTLPKEKDRVYVAYRRVGESGSGPSAKALAAVDKLLADIVTDALK